MAQQGKFCQEQGYLSRHQLRMGDQKYGRREFEGCGCGGRQSV